MVKKVTIGSKGQITLPKVLRDKYHMSYGKSVIVSDSGEGIIIKHWQWDFERDIKRQSGHRRIRERH